jgi:phosphatidylserine synthase
MFLLFLLLQFFGPVMILMEVLPLNFGLIWPAVSVIISSYVMIDNIKVKNMRNIFFAGFFAWCLVLTLNTLNYLALGLLYSLTSFFLSAVYLLLLILGGSLLGMAFYQEENKN